MRATMAMWIICASVACPGGALAAPRPKTAPPPNRASAPVATPNDDARAKYQAAVQLDERGEPENALVRIAEGLAMDAQDLPLLELKGRILLKLRDYLGALDAYQAYLDAGAQGANAREARKIIKILEVAKTTFLEITLANGPAVIYLGSKTQGVFCTASPSCNQPMLPGSYRVIAERPGFDRWTGQVTVVKDQTAKLAVTLVEKPSLLTVRVAQPGAHVTVDDTDYSAPAPVAAGSHRVTVSLPRHKEERREVSAHEGKPVELDITLTPLVPVRLEPPGAKLSLDDAPIAIEDGSLAVPPGAHILVARAPGFHDRRIEIPTDRAADYMLAVELARVEVVAPPPPAPSRFTGRRKIAVAVGGVGVLAAAGGVVLGLQSKQRENDAYALCPSPSSPCFGARRADDLILSGQSRALQANIAFGVAGGAAIAAAVLWLTGAPESRVAVTPRLGAVAGLDLAVRF